MQVVTDTIAKTLDVERSKCVQMTPIYSSIAPFLCSSLQQNSWEQFLYLLSLIPLFSFFSGPSFTQALKPTTSLSLPQSRSPMVASQSSLYLAYHLTLVIAPFHENTSPHWRGTPVFCVFFYLLLFLQCSRARPQSQVLSICSQSPLPGKGFL